MMNDMLMRLMAQMRENRQGAQMPVGMAPPQQPLPQGQALQPFMASGPYGQQALQLAGLLGGPPGGPGGAPSMPGAMPPGVPPRRVGGAPYTPGLFMPGFRPDIDTPVRGGGGRTPYPIRPV